MAPTTVLYLLDHTSLGGGETSFVDFIKEAGKRKDLLRPVVILRGEGTLSEALREARAALEFVDFPMRLRRGFLPWFSFDAKGKIGAIIDKHRPAIVHANNFFGMFYGGSAARERAVPLVWTCHGWWELDNRAKRKIARKYVTRAVAVSASVREEAARLTGNAFPIGVDYLGISPFSENESAADRQMTRADVRREMNVADGTKLLAVAGRFQPVKGHALLLKALPSILEKHPNLKLWFIGDSILDDSADVREQERLKKIVKEAGWQEQVLFLGWRKDARRLMRALDALAVPSERESFCMAAVEGLEAGIPVVGPNGWGPAEIILPPATGQLFDPGDDQSLAENILKVLGENSGFDPEAGPRRVAKLFSVRAHLDRTIKLYGELM